MTPEEFEQEMRTISHRSDTELAHMDADALLCRVLADAGYRNGVEVFREMDKWYS